MAWSWSGLDVLDAWLATDPPEDVREQVLRALAELMESADLVEGDPVPGEHPLLRRLVVGPVEIRFLRAEQFRTLRLLRLAAS